MRRLLRQQIRIVADGNRPLHVTDLRSNPIPTYGGDSVLQIKQGESEEGAYLSKLAHELMDIQYAVDDRPEAERIAYVTEKMQAIEARDSAGD